ncbi:hypothetical protein L596_018793 [Steinernema carpocapsae]|uniref:SKP1 component POZ domain-containing protein n=1 Tax=Steinernema carpocapsae TaxID=34508 RepID=A0A4U5N5X2_STECR|nr:hypothetical protein L596_018793 [Steinernema carpocapsae]
MHPSIEIVSADGVSFLYKLRDLPKSLLLTNSVEVPKGSVTFEGLEFLSSDSWKAILEWLEIHRNEGPKTQAQRDDEFYDRNSVAEDMILFGRMSPRSKLTALRFAAEFLIMPDLLNPLWKYITKKMAGKSSSEVNAWFREGEENCENFGVVDFGGLGVAKFDENDDKNESNEIEVITIDDDEIGVIPIEDDDDDEHITPYN